MGANNFIKIIDSYEYVASSLLSLSANLNLSDVKYTQTVIERYNLDSEFIVEDVY